MRDRVDSTGITQGTYDRIAPEYTARIEGLVSDSWIGEYESGLVDRFLSMLPGDAPGVLDIGCGGGKDTRHFRREGARVVAIDLSAGMLAEARKRVPGGVFCRMDMRGLGFSAGTFDGVWANGCIYHVPKADIAGVFGEIGRVLRPAGTLSFNFKAGTGEGLDEAPASFGGGPRFYAYYQGTEMKDLLSQAGFRVLEMTRYPEKVLGEEIIQAWARRA